VTDAPPRLLLASRSPRRRQLLRQLGLEFEVIDVAIDERPAPAEAPFDYVPRLAAAKARAAWSALARRAGRILLAADTSVICDDAILGKPRDAEHALAMLARLSGRSHEVLTAVALADEQGLQTALSASRVSFRELSETEIRAYWRTGEPCDKAGAYAIQGLGACFVERLAGSYSGVMGLPLFETAALLHRAGLDVLGGS